MSSTAQQPGSTLVPPLDAKCNESLSEKFSGMEMARSMPPSCECECLRTSRDVHSR